ncbi:MAG TPA: CoA transferase [Trebonia sp.]
MRPEERLLMKGPLDGLLVADFSRLLAGPHATMLLGDLGADVVKVEHPEGDVARNWGPPFIGDGSASAYFHSANRNKRGAIIDLRTSEGRAMARRLALRADVVVHNFRPGIAEDFGLGYEDLRHENPGLIHCAISGFGLAAGPNSLGNDLLVQAVGGLMSITGTADGEHVKVGFPVVDILTGCYAAIGILSAYAERGRSGQGQHLEVDLFSSLLGSLGFQAANHLNFGLTGRTLGTGHPGIVPYAAYRAADRDIVIAATSDRQFAALVRAIGKPELAGDPRFAQNPDRVAHRDILREELERVLMQRRARDWMPVLFEAGVPAGVVNTIPEAFEVAKAAGLMPEVWLTTTDGASVGSPANPIRFGRTPATYRTASPALGEHTDAVLRELRTQHGDTGSAGTW